MLRPARPLPKPIRSCSFSRGARTGNGASRATASRQRPRPAPERGPIGAASQRRMGEMKAVFIRRYGGPEGLEYGEFADPVLSAGDVLVKAAAAAINPIDIMERSGLTKDFKPISFPGVLGWDLSGTVVQVGPGALGFSVGDRVPA